jgi:hypothetical protein
MPPNLNYYKTVNPAYPNRPAYANRLSRNNTTVGNSGRNNNRTIKLRRGIGSRHLPVPHHVKFKGNHKKIFRNTVENVESRISLGNNNYKNIYNTRRKRMTEEERNAENEEERQVNLNLRSKMPSANEVSKYRKKILVKLKPPNNN